MAAVVQKNGMKPLQMVNGNLSHLSDGASLNIVKLEDGGQCVIKNECVDETVINNTTTGSSCYINNDSGNSYVVKQEYMEYGIKQEYCADNKEFVTLDRAGANTVSDANNGDEPEIDIVINNVVCSFSVRCHLNLRQIALNGINVEYRRENGVS